MEVDNLNLLLGFIKEGGFTAVFIVLFIMERNAHRETLNKYMEFMRDTVYQSRARRDDGEEPTRSRRPANFPNKIHQYTPDDTPLPPDIG